MRHLRLAIATITGTMWPGLLLAAVPQTQPGGFQDAKTVFQTNLAYDPRIAMAVDAVIVHQHGAAADHLTRSIDSWKRQGFRVGRMFFADSDATNAYWKGQWDGTPHPDEVERDRAGNPILCAGVRPYMLPAEGWTRYLEEMTRDSLKAGAAAILPEEPLAHIHTGYEKAFATIWEKRYGRPWQPGHASPEARFLTGQLKNELYLALEKRLSTQAKRGGDVAFVVPIHSIYSNIAAHLVAPLGTSCGTPGFDGYIGQIWTGPVNWALANYNSPDKSFFGSAYILYDYFTQLTVETDRRLWLLIDPVEDDPRHKWTEFERWYRQCVVASMMFRGVSAFEVMPWPDRIFLPGAETGGGTPAPEGFRISILSAMQAQQDVPDEAVWITEGSVTSNIGVAVSDSIMWENDQHPCLQGMFGMLMPLAQAGVPVSSFVAERSGDVKYLARFKVIVLSYEPWKPASEQLNVALAEWVRGGGSLVVLGEPETIDGDLWWKRGGFSSPLHHLTSLLGIDLAKDVDSGVGKGWVLRRAESPSRFADPGVASRTYLPLVDSALRKAGVKAGLQPQSGFRIRRGPFVAAHAIKSPVELRGTFIDVFDPDLPLRDGVKLEVDTSGLYREVGDIVVRGEPCVLHATHRLMSQNNTPGALTFVIRGPAETPAVARVFRGKREPASVAAHDTNGRSVAVDTREDGPTLRMRFPNVPEGVTVAIRWK